MRSKSSPRAEAGAVHGCGLLHEDIEALLNSVVKLGPAERRRRGHDRHVARLEAVQRFLVGIEADKTPAFGHSGAIGELLAEILVAGSKPVGKYVGHGDQLDGAALGAQGILGGAGAPAAATDQGHLNGIILAGVDLRDGHPRQGGRHGNPSGRLHHLAARQAAVGALAHNGTSLTWCARSRDE
jgi:hypothetical protein